MENNTEDLGSSHQPKRKKKEEVPPKVPVASPSTEVSSTYFASSDERGGSRFTREFFDQDCVSLSKALLGTVLCRKISSTGEVLKGTIVETEVYPGEDDKASHSYNGKRTSRNEAMYMDPGTIYVYSTYGMYYCFNISSRGEGAASLIRAVEPLEDYATMHKLRSSSNKKSEDPSKVKTKKPLAVYELANGPSKLCLSFDIKRDTFDKIDICVSDEIWLESSSDDVLRNKEFEVVADKRIGIDGTPLEARNQLWRFYIKNNWSESRAKVKELKKIKKVA